MQTRFAARCDQEFFWPYLPSWKYYREQDEYRPSLSPLQWPGEKVRPLQLRQFYTDPMKEKGHPKVAHLLRGQTTFRVAPQRCPLSSPDGSKLAPDELHQ